MSTYHTRTDPDDPDSDTTLLARIRAGAGQHPMLTRTQLARRLHVPESTVTYAILHGWVREVVPSNGYRTWVVRDNWMQEAMHGWLWATSGRRRGELPDEAEMRQHAQYLESIRADIVGATEIAERCGVDRATVEQWRRRYPEFPRPLDDAVGGRPAWEWRDVLPWLVSTGRVQSDVTS